MSSAIYFTPKRSFAHNANGAPTGTLPPAAKGSDDMAISDCPLLAFPSLSSTSDSSDLYTPKKSTPSFTLLPRIEKKTGENMSSGKLSHRPLQILEFPPPSGLPPRRCSYHTSTPYGNTSENAALSPQDDVDDLKIPLLTPSDVVDEDNFGRGLPFFFPHDGVVTSLFNVFIGQEALNPKSKTDLGHRDHDVQVDGQGEGKQDVSGESQDETSRHPIPPGDSSTDSCRHSFDSFDGMGPQVILSYRKTAAISARCGDTNSQSLPDIPVMSSSLAFRGSTVNCSSRR